MFTFGARTKERKKVPSKVLLEFFAQKQEETMNKKGPPDNFPSCQELRDHFYACGSAEQED